MSYHIAPYLTLPPTASNSISPSCTGFYNSMTTDLQDSIHAGTRDPSHLKITRVCTVHSNNTERSIPEWSLLTVTAESVNADIAVSHQMKVNEEPYPNPPCEIQFQNYALHAT